MRLARAGVCARARVAGELTAPGAGPRRRVSRTELRNALARERLVSRTLRSCEHPDDRPRGDAVHRFLGRAARYGIASGYEGTRPPPSPGSRCAATLATLRNRFAVGAARTVPRLASRPDCTKPLRGRARCFGPGVHEFARRSIITPNPPPHAACAGLQSRARWRKARGWPGWGDENDPAVAPSIGGRRDRRPGRGVGCLATAKQFRRIAWGCRAAATPGENPAAPQPGKGCVTGPAWWNQAKRLRSGVPLAGPVLVCGLLKSMRLPEDRKPAASPCIAAAAACQGNTSPTTISSPHRPAKTAANRIALGLFQRGRGGLG